MRKPKAKVLTNKAARALFEEVDQWLARTGGCWAHLAAEAGLSQAIKCHVVSGAKGLGQESASAIRAAMARHPGGVPLKEGQRVFLSPEETGQLADEIRAWLDRTGAPLSALANRVNRSPGGLMRLLECPQRVGPATARKYREIMAANPDRWASSTATNVPMLAHPGVPPLVDPFADRRDEADRMRKQWIAQQASEHQRKYGRPLGRPLEEMVA